MPTLLLEVGTEELPADFVSGAIAQWQDRIPKSLTEHLLPAGAVEVYGTPRRLALLVRGLPPNQPDREETFKGPPASAAFQGGKPTPAAEGFARKQGVEVGALILRETEKGEFVFVQKKLQGRKAAEILPELIPDWIAGLEGKRFMRWGDGNLRFPRPIRWLVALLDRDLLPVTLANGTAAIGSGRLSQGHRTLHPEPVEIPQASAYRDCLRSAGVAVDPAERRQTIQEQVGTAARQLGGVAEIPPDLLAEVTQLVEWPTAVAGKFDPDFLSLPPEVIVTVMVTHQRYFPVRATAAADSPLLPYFITVANGDPAQAGVIAAGNERVIRARLADARFFYQADCDQPLDSYLPQLETVTFQEELGTMRDKVDRILETAQQIAEQLDLDPQQRGEIEAAAMLCKADLVTQMVQEFPELQGVMGQKYALASGESPAVAQGIFEHYLPRGAGDRMPESLVGQVVGLADRLDTLANVFGLGLIPTGSSDPFALRRAANATVNITWQAQLPINLAQLLEQGSRDFTTAHPEKAPPLEPLRAFFIQRLQTLLQDDLGIDYDLVNAVLGEEDADYTERALEDLLDLRDRAQFLQQIRQNGQLDAIYETVNRSARLAQKGDLDFHVLDPSETVRPDWFQKPSEQAFYQALLELFPQAEAARADSNYQRLVQAIAAIVPTVSQFFDGPESVLVMDDNPDLQRNRLNLLGLLRNHARVLADFGAIVRS